MALAYRLSMNMHLDLKQKEKDGQTKLKMPMAGSCIDLSENVTIHLQYSDSENEYNVSSIVKHLYFDQIHAKKTYFEE